MHEDGVIQGLTVTVDPKRVGLPVTAIVLLKVMPNHARTPDLSLRWSRIRKLEAMPEVEFVAHLAGEFDLLVLVRVRDNEHLSTFVSQDIRGVRGNREHQDVARPRRGARALGRAAAVETPGGDSGDPVDDLSASAQGCSSTLIARRSSIAR